MIAYILAIVEPLKEHTVYTSLGKNTVVDEVFPLFGEWDLIIKVTAESNEELIKHITENISNLDGILSTKTLIGY